MSYRNNFNHLKVHVSVSKAIKTDNVGLGYRLVLKIYIEREIDRPHVTIVYRALYFQNAFI